MQQEISEPSNEHLWRTSRHPPTPSQCYICDNEISGEGNGHNGDSLNAKHIYYLLKSLFVGSLAQVCKTAYFIEQAHLHERANLHFKKQMSRQIRSISFWIWWAKMVEYKLQVKSTWRVRALDYKQELWIQPNPTSGMLRRCHEKRIRNMCLLFHAVQIDQSGFFFFLPSLYKLSSFFSFNIYLLAIKLLNNNSLC